MTTIAYKDGIIAYDSRATRGDLISCDNANKCFKYKGVLFFICGAVADAKHLAECYVENKQPNQNADIAAYVVDNGRVFRVGIDGGVFFVEDSRNVDAMGSGCLSALTAMDMGADAITAVKMAAKRDVNTGGKIRHYKVK